MSDRVIGGWHGPPASDELGQTCEVVWWQGYVRGCFQAQIKGPRGKPLAMAESPLLWWPRFRPPDETRATVSALETLVQGLIHEGWEVVGRGESWYEYRLQRADRSEQPAVRENVVHIDDRRDEVSTVLLEELRSELAHAQQEAEHERERRVRAEDELIEALLGPPPEQETPAAPPQALPGERRLRVLYAGYAAVVAAAAAISFVAFGSLYAAVVAALTASALELGFDGWLVTRAPHRAPAPEDDRLVRGPDLPVHR